MYNTQYHLVWTPRYRRRILVKGVRDDLKRILLHLEDVDEDIEVKKVSIGVDHVHLVVVIPPRLAVAGVVQFFKSRTAKKLKEKYAFIRKAIWKNPGIWSRGYCVSTVGLNERQVMAYVEHQEKEDKGQIEIEFGG